MQATPPETPAPAETVSQFYDSDTIDHMYLTFIVGAEDYGVSIARVTEIVGMQRIMGVPDVPDHIVGVINLRGKVIPLMNVRRRFGMPDREHDDRTVIIVLDIGNAPVGLIVDRVSEVLDIPPDRIDQSSLVGSGTRSVVRALGRLDDRVVILLDAEAMVAEGDIRLPAMAGG